MRKNRTKLTCVPEIESYNLGSMGINMDLRNC
jgi:hypothetical protein